MSYMNKAGKAKNRHGGPISGWISTSRKPPLQADRPEKQR